MNIRTLARASYQICRPVILLVAVSGCGRPSDGPPPNGKSSSQTTDYASADDKANGPKTLRGHTASIRQVEFSADGKRLLTASSGQTFVRRGGKLEAKPADDKSARLWDISTGKELSRFEQHEAGPKCAAISADGQLAATSDGKIIRVWTTAEKAEQKWELKDAQSPVVALVFSADGGRLGAAEEGGMVRIWEMSSGHPLAAWKQRTTASRGLVFSGDGKHLAAVSDSGVEVWDPTRSLPLRELQDVKPLAAVFAADSKRLLMLIQYDATERPADGVEVYQHGVTLHEWDVDTGMISSHDPLVTRGVEQAAIAPDGSVFVVAGRPLNGEMAVYVYDIAEKKEVGQFDVPHDGGLGPEPSVLMSVAPGGRVAAIGVYHDLESGNGAVGIDTIKLYDLPK